MSNLIQLLQENQRLKNQLNKLKQINNLTPYINDNIIKGGYHVVKTIVDRDNIDCCYRKLGMKVLVVGNDLSFKEYILKTNDCKESIWEEINVTIEENEVFLTEATNFAQIEQTQKDFNKNVSDYKELVDGNIQDLQKDAKTTDIVIATTTVGAINAGQTIEVGTNIQKLTELLFDKTYYPTFVNPTFSLTNNSINSPKEVGSLANITLTFNFNQGKILGKLDNGIWNPTMLQDYRAGAATSYSLNGVSNNPATMSVLVSPETNTLSGSVTYAAGVQPKDSKNNNYDNPLPAGTSPVQNTFFEGIYPYFYYKSKFPITPEIMQSAIANGQATKVLASSTGTITIPFLPNGEYIAVAYPATSTTKTIWYVNALDSGDIPGGVLGSATTLPCNSPTGLWNNVNFKIHVSPGILTQENPVQLKNS